MATTYPTSVETRQTVPDIPNPQHDGTIRELSTWLAWATDALCALEAKVGAGAASGLERANLEESSLALHDVEHLVRGADGAALAVSETAGDFFRAIGTNQWNIQGEAAISETEVSVGWLSFTLPLNYVAGGDITIRAVVDVTGSGTLGTCTIDFEARLADDSGAVGSDLVTTDATAISATAGAKDFVVTPTDLEPGDKLVIKMTTSVQESAGSAIQALITKLQVLCDVKG